ncbi:hypothetical protein BpHYR1_014483 [Brachionus plicatilis]|uniref:Uncharacterized protein n=1 Tax=Brachionus plicatilis TaxID=10195 RepID=A0A3M7R9V4_BRAPC|nr:hypothetical protein BpHYR1_014483 [Brachionus plicatilis]
MPLKKFDHLSDKKMVTMQFIKNDSLGISCIPHDVEVLNPMLKKGIKSVEGVHRLNEELRKLSYKECLTVRQKCLYKMELLYKSSSEWVKKVSKMTDNQLIIYYY